MTGLNAPDPANKEARAATKASGLSTDQRRIGLGLIAALAAEAINKAAPLVTLHLAQARLGVASFGRAQFALMSVEALIPFVAFGYGTLGALEIGANQGDQRSVQRTMSGILLLRWIHLAVVGGWLAYFLAEPSHTGQAGVFMGASILLLASCLETDFAHYGSQTSVARNIFTMLAKVSGVVGVVLFVHGPADTAIYAAVASMPALVLALCSLAFNWRSLAGRPAVRGLGRLLWRATPYAVVGILLTFADRYDTLLVEKIFDANGVGFYTGSQRLVQSISTAASGIGVVFFSELLACRDKASFSRLSSLSLWVMTALVAPVAAGIPFVAKPLLALMYGGEFPAYSSVLIALAFGALFQTAVQVFGVQILLIKRRVLAFALILAGSILGGGAAAFGLGQVYGLGGVAAGSCIGKALACLAFAVAAGQHLDGLPWRRLFQVFLPTVVMVLALLALGQSSLWVNIAVGGVAYTASFLLSNRQECRQLLQKLRLRSRA